ncbi:MAG: PilT/PilU family type 4a pilus ATPase [Clostridia bacterium]|nr:PilT/PilU family type 4a pilus ATPase [Clostridia bacterium]
MELSALLKQAIELGGSDIFIIPGAPVKVKAGGDLVPVGERILPAGAEELIGQAYAYAGRERNQLDRNGDDDFSFSIPELCRFRSNVYRQRGTLAATLRIVAFGLPNPDELGIPKLIIDLTSHRNGMILVTGPAGSGKSTTLACMVDRINRTRSGHIVTIEDPIEYLHRHDKSLVSQREVPGDVVSFARALRSVLRQAPDVIMLGEMRDQETIRTAMTAAETGHLLLSSLHTVGAAKTIDRIIDAFPAEQQAQIRMQLSMVLQAVVSQRLVPCVNGGQVAVFEVMSVNPAIRNMIRDGRTHQIDNAIAGGDGMLSMDNELARLVKAGTVARETALIYAQNPDMLSKRI